ncbi:MAG: hypothetical protein R3B96_06335 [Pirellulaceae bacterium]
MEVTESRTVGNRWGPPGYYDTFGPELSFAGALRANGEDSVAIAKFTHSGSQIIDWPAGSELPSRNLYPDFIAFVKEGRRGTRGERAPSRAFSGDLLPRRRERHVMESVSA